MNEKVDKVKCTECKQEIEVTRAVCWGKVRCYKCWEIGINKEKVKELREQLSQYIEVGGSNKPKENLTLSQLESARQIFKDNYFGELDERSKEILNALVWMDEDGPRGANPLTKTEKAIERKIEELKRASEPQPKSKTHTRNCPVCDKKFSCEEPKESYTPEKDAKEELNEQIDKHIEEVHKQKEEQEIPNSNKEKTQNKPSANQTSEQTNRQSSSVDANSKNANESENKFLLPLIIITLLLVVGGTVAFFLKKKKNITTFIRRFKREPARSSLSH